MIGFLCILWVVHEMRDKMEGKGKRIETKKQEKQAKNKIRDSIIS